MLCRDCGVLLTGNNSARAYGRRCRYCFNRRRNRKQSREYNLRAKYRLSLEEYELLAQSQNWTCAICECDVNMYLVVDHDKASGKIRGLLCTQCNQGLGLFDHNVKWLQAAALYLLKS